MKTKPGSVTEFANWLMWICGVVVFSIVVRQAPAAEEFRVASKVFSGKDDTATSDSLTLFADDRAYDFLTSPNEITVFDFPRDRIVLLDPNRRLRTELTTEKLNEFTDQLRARAYRQTEALLKFSANPKFDESRDDEWRQFASPQMTYRVHPIKPEHPDIARDYRKFCDWSARVNAMIRPGAIPPFPRLAVNAALERDGEIPESVELSLAAQNRLVGKPTVLHSEHEMTMRLLPADRKKIDEAGRYLVSFPEVSLEEYLRPIQQAKR